MVPGEGTRGWVLHMAGHRGGGGGRGTRGGGGGGGHHKEHRPQRPSESVNPTQHAKGRAGDCPGPR